MTLKSKIFVIILMCLFPFNADSQTDNEIFERFVGREILMDSNICTRVLADTPGKKHFFDTDGDGSPDVMYFIDTDERHGDSRQPLLVKVVDEDGDMTHESGGDLDSDLYVADWYGDGTIDRIVDYADLDGDNDVDEQYLYQSTENEGLKRRMPKSVPGKAYLVAWAKDYGDDNRLWYHTNYEYGQRITQWKTDFNGDEMFVYLFFYDYETNKLIPIWENAFSFYDLDGDTFSEEVVRFTGTGAMTDDLRYSMDIDNDNNYSDTNNGHHDYDFSLSCLGPVVFSPGKCRTVTIRGITTDPIIRWEDMRQVAKAGPWIKIHLTWDENDNNIDPRPGEMHYERWEGVLNHRNTFMKQVGGPSCGPYNKRNEIDVDASGDMQLYTSPVDRRLHLFGAEVGWIDVDYDFDDTIDMSIHMHDYDGDGFFDTWKYDVNADSLFERTVTIADDRCDILPFDYAALHDAFRPLIEGAEEANSAVIAVMKNILMKEEQDFSEDSIEIYFNEHLKDYDSEFGIGKKIVSSPEGRRFYLDCIRERYWQRLERLTFAKNPSFDEIRRSYESGDYERAAELLGKSI